MPPMYRLSQPGRRPVADVGSVEGVEAVIRASEPGQYQVDEITAEPLTSGHTSRRWGGGINRLDGEVTLDPDPWPER
jgi:hypothetical protein